MRTFDTGATRDSDTDKLDYEGFFHPLAVERFAQYMHKHRKQPDGNMRESDNWQKGIPLTSYMKSAHRHLHDWWKEHRGFPTKDGIEDAICALIFNCFGYLTTILVERHNRVSSAKMLDMPKVKAIPLSREEMIRQACEQQAQAAYPRRNCIPFAVNKDYTAA